MGVTPPEANGICSHPVLEYGSQQVSPLHFSGARFIKSITAFRLIFLVKHSNDFQGGYSHPVTEKHHPQQFLCGAGRGSVFSPGTSWFKMQLLSVFPHFPMKKSSFSLMSVALLLPSAQWHSLSKFTVRLGPGVGAPPASSIMGNPKTKPLARRYLLRVASCKPCDSTTTSINTVVLLTFFSSRLRLQP